MKPSLKLALLSFSLLSVSPTVLAQSYSATVADLNTIFNPPPSIIPSLCDLHTSAVNGNGYRACADAVAEADTMAKKYAGNAGKYLGCLDGYYQGVADGFDAGKNPSAEMLKNAQAYVSGATFVSATTRGLERARAEGTTESADQIIARYRAVVGQKDPQGRPVQPNKEYNFPKINFMGFDDGYEFDILKQGGSEFDEVVKHGWVTSSSAFDDKVAARKANSLIPNGKSICNQQDTVFFGRTDVPSYISLWDFFRAHRQYNFQKYGWRNPEWAWEVFTRDERTFNQLQSWSRLEKLTKETVETIPQYTEKYKLDANGAPIPKKDAAGVAIPGQFEMEQVLTGYKTEKKIVNISAEEVAQLKGIYTQSFKDSYDRYYARVYASQSYYAEALDKYKIATALGKAIGEEVAGHTARKDAYNGQYKVNSAKQYAAEVKNIYKTSFDRLIGIFENNSVMNITDAKVQGQVADGIFRPGEELRVAFSVENLGEKSLESTMSFENSADVQAATKGFTFSAPVLDRATFTTGVLGRINDNKEARSIISVGMAIKAPGNMEDVARLLKAREGQQLTLNEYAEIEAVKGSLDYLQGRVDLLVDMKNPASIDSNLVSVLQINLGQMGLADKNVEPIGARSVRPVAIGIDSMDPLALIIAGGVSGSANVVLGTKSVHRVAVQFNVADERRLALAKYLDALATRKSTNVGRESREDRVAKLIGMMEQFTMEAIEANVKWKKEMGETIIKTIQDVYNESKRANRIDPQAQALYDQLGKILAVHIKDRNFRAGGFLGNEKKNKEAFLSAIAVFAKVSTRVKDY